MQKPWYKRTLVLLGIIFTLLIFLGLFLFIYQLVHYYKELKMSQGIKDSHIGLTIEQQKELDRRKNIARGSKNEPFIGDKNAQNEVVEFIDYSCPFCKTTSGVGRDLVRASKKSVKVIFRDYPMKSIHPNAWNSARLARCVWAQDSDKYIRFHDLLFTHQSQQDLNSLFGYANRLGLDMEKLQICFNSARFEQNIKKSMVDAEALHVNGTPTFIVNGLKIQGKIDVNDLIKLLK